MSAEGGQAQVGGAAPNGGGVVDVDGSSGDPANDATRRQMEAVPIRGSLPFASLSALWEELDRPKAMSLLVLVFVNLINYMDRSTVAGMMDSIRKDPAFHIESDKYLGLLQGW